MAELVEHEKDCDDILGKPFTEIHEFLDQYAEKYPPKIFDDQHRQYLHNEKGIEKVGQEFGEEARNAALLHVAKDLFGYIPKSFGIGKFKCHFFGRTLEVEIDDGGLVE